MFSFILKTSPSSSHSFVSSQSLIRTQYKVSFCCHMKYIFSDVLEKSQIGPLKTRTSFFLVSLLLDDSSNNLTSLIIFFRHSSYQYFQQQLFQLLHEQHVQLLFLTPVTDCLTLIKLSHSTELTIVTVKMFHISGTAALPVCVSPIRLGYYLITRSSIIFKNLTDIDLQSL